MKKKILKNIFFSILYEKNWKTILQHLLLMFNENWRSFVAHVQWKLNFKLSYQWNIITFLPLSHSMAIERLHRVTTISIEHRHSVTKMFHFSLFDSRITKISGYPSLNCKCCLYKQVGFMWPRQWVTAIMIIIIIIVIIIIISVIIIIIFY